MRLEQWFYILRNRLRSLLLRSQMERELEEEFAIHLSVRMEQEVAAGKTPEEARYAALRAMEGMEQRKEECRDTRRMHWFEDLLQDGRYAIRTMIKRRAFAAVGALVLALGIGATTAVFTIVHAVLLEPLPFSQPDRLFLVSCVPKNNPFVFAGPYMSDRDYLAFRHQDRVFEYLATFSGESLTLTGAGDPVVINALTVTPDFFRLLRAQPRIGRGFLREGEAEPNAVLLSDSLWRGRFGADAAIVGKGIRLDDVRYTVVGVMPPGFTFQNAQLWTRMEVRTNPNNSSMRPVIGRLKAGVSPEQAQAELQTFASGRPLDPGESRTDLDARVTPLRELFVANVRKLLLIFAGAVGFVFLIACANFANLLLIRGASRKQEIAVRASLGASRWRLVRQLLAESTLLSFAGGILGILLAVGGVGALLAILPSGKVPRVAEIHLDSWVLAFTFVLCLITGVVFGLAPALSATRPDLQQAASGEARGISSRQERLRGALVTAEIASALILLTGAGLLLKSFLRTRSVNPGFRAENLITAAVDLPDSRYLTAAQMRALDNRVLAGLSALPGADSAAAVSWIPFGAGLVRGDFQLEDGRHLPRGFLVDKPVVSPGYFRTMGIRLLRGRAFTERDNLSEPGVGIISESVARRLWPRGDAIGKRISMEDHPKPEDWLTIVGIVDDVKQSKLTDAPSAGVYQPYGQIKQPFFLRHITFVVETPKTSAAMAAGIRAVIHKMDWELPADSITTMQAAIAESMAEARLDMRLLGTFSVIALLLAAMGLYGVLACAVVERTHEIGVRMAIGAEATDVVWMVLRRTLALAGSGVIIGTLGALAITRVLGKFLFDVKPTDPFTFFSVAGMLVIVALLSAWIPARRAARVYPVAALRYE